MPTTKSARQRMKEAVEAALAAGNNDYANEITANVMVGTTMMIIFAVMLLCLLLNELGIFTADRATMRWAVLIAAVIEVPITVLNTIYVGTKKWLRVPLMIDLILVTATLAATLGHNITLVMLFPVIVSTRYFDARYTRVVAAITVVVFAAATVICGYVGIMNLNMVTFPDGTTVTVQAGQTLREAVAAALPDKGAYVRSLMLNEYAPRAIVYICLSVSCCYVSSRGKQMIRRQAETSAKSSRIEAELDLATHIQTSMLPCLLPAFPGHENIDLRALYRPAKEVGGDFYDYFIIDKTHVGVVIADVSGKGVGAALFMTISKTVLKNQLQLGISPAEALTNANRQLCESNDAELFVTCWAGVYDTEANTLTFVNAGHNPPVVLRQGQEPEFLQQTTGFVLAGLDGYTYRQQSIRLEPGDGMLFYTDGVTEATDAQKELFGNDRLLSCLSACSDAPVTEQLDRLMDAVDAFVGDAEQFDDITVMSMRINA